MKTSTAATVVVVVVVVVAGGGGGGGGGGGVLFCFVKNTRRMKKLFVLNGNSYCYCCLNHVVVLSFFVPLSLFLGPA